MGKAINQNAGEDKVRAWRVAHSGLCMGGVMLMVVAVVVGQLGLTGVARASVVWPAVVSGYGFAVGLPFGAITGQRGLHSGGGPNQVVYLGNVFGAYGSLISTFALLVVVVKRLVVT